MGLLFSTPDTDGSCKSVAETFAFPYEIANAHHQAFPLESVAGVMYYKYTPHNVGSKVLVFCHGNAMTVSQYTVQPLRALADRMKATLYMVEYPGYGESKDLGTPTAESCATALEFMIINIVSTGVRYEDIYIMGHSIGTGVVARYAYKYRETPHGGMILVSPYKSILTVVLDNKMAEYSSSSLNFYRTIDALPEIHWPILVVHGIHDNVINVSHSRELALTNKEINFYEVNSDHNMIIGDAIVHEIIRQFVN